MIDQIAASNDPITTLADALRAQLEFPIADLAPILPHLLNLSIHGSGSSKSLVPFNIAQLYDIETMDAAIMGTDNTTRSMGQVEMLPGQSVNVIASTLQSWDQLRSLADLFKIESEMCRFIFSQMVQQEKIDWAKDFSVEDQKFLGFTDREIEALQHHGFVFQSFSPAIKAAIAGLGLEDQGFIH